MGYESTMLIYRLSMAADTIIFDETSPESSTAASENVYCVPVARPVTVVWNPAMLSFHNTSAVPPVP
jgi:hypothetical protein